MPELIVPPAFLRQFPVESSKHPAESLKPFANVDVAVPVMFSPVV